MGLNVGLLLWLRGRTWTISHMCTHASIPFLPRHHLLLEQECRRPMSCVSLNVFPSLPHDFKRDLRRNVGMNSLIGFNVHRFHFLKTSWIFIWWAPSPHPAFEKESKSEHRESVPYGFHGLVQSSEVFERSLEMLRDNASYGTQCVSSSPRDCICNSSRYVYSTVNSLFSVF